MAISDRTRKLLWGRSGNRCAICREELVIDTIGESEESVVGDECHIVSGQAEGPRYDPSFPIDRIDHVSNLLLLCRVHHKIVDDQEETYTADILRLKKAEHEKWVRATIAAAVKEDLDENRPGVDVGYRRTFVSDSAFFVAKTPRLPNPILDFSHQLRGRAPQLEALNSLLESPTQSISILSGRGGLGKSKLLHDWSTELKGWSVVFLKEAPVWHADSVNEIPAGNVVIVVDDAHRTDSLGHVLQLFGELRSRQNLKLVLSTRPGGVLELEMQLYRSFGAAEVIRLPNLDDLTGEQAELLAQEVLGEDFGIYGRDLAHVSDNSPLVIVAGGNLIVSRHILPAEMSGIEDFRLTVFSRFYEELRLSGPDFAINPPRPLLQVIAAIGPVNAASEEFLGSVEAFLDCSSSDILATLDALATHGVVTPRTEPVRIVPDVLSDYVLETACVNSGGLSTGYADRIFEAFGDQFFERLMQNLSELDWRLGRVGRGLDLLESVWMEIYTRFREADTRRRRKLLEELRPAAVYQPGKILELVRLARTEQVSDDDIRRIFRVGSEYVLETLPVLLEAIAYHPDFTSRSVDVLWELVSEEDSEKRSDSSAKGTLERLASYQRYKWPAFNFAMLLQAVRLCKRPDVFDRTFTPLDLVDEILEPEGEFTEYRGNAIAYGGFGLNPVAVTPVRQNAMEFLETLLHDARCVAAVGAVRSLGRLLPNVMNRMGRDSGPTEITWQQAERLQVIQLLTQRLSVQPVSLPLRRSIVHALRFAKGVNCSAEIRDRAGAEVDKVEWDLDLLVFDAVCCRQGDFPITSTSDPAGSWQTQSEAQLTQLAAALEERYRTVEEKASELITTVKIAYGCRLQPNGFERIVGFFRNDGALLSALVDRISADPDSPALVNELSIALAALQSARPAEFRVRAQRILADGALHQVIAAAAALRVDADNVSAGDVSLVERYLAFPDSRVRRHGLHAIAFMGKKPEIRPALLRAALSVDVRAETEIAIALVDSFGPFGIPLALLSADDLTQILAQLATIDDFSAHQGAIPSFLSRLTNRFPDQVLEFLLCRIEVEDERRANGDWDFRAIDGPFGYVSFGDVEPEARSRLVQMCLDRYLQAIPPALSYRSLFWTVLGGLDNAVLSVLTRNVAGAEGDCVDKILTLIQTSPGRLVLGNPEFVKDFLRNLNGEARHEAIDAFVGNAYSLGTGGGAGDPNQMIENNNRAIANVLPAFRNESDMQDLCAALSSVETPKYDFGRQFGLQLPTD
jgi:hypothetical protein